jgi:hypothetical protein
VTWPQLAEVKSKGWKTTMQVTWPESLTALDGSEIVITGYMYPLGSGEGQSHFLLSAYQPTCPFCLPGGPNELIDVADTAEVIPYNSGQTSLKGILHLHKTAEELKEGMLYSLAGAAALP